MFLAILVFLDITFLYFLHLSIRLLLVRLRILQQAHQSGMMMVPQICYTWLPSTSL